MKAIMLSVQPKWVEKILNGEKTIEIRKTKPNCELPIKVYIYCTKGNPYLQKLSGSYELIDSCYAKYMEENLNGKVVAEFALNKPQYLNLDGLSFYMNTNLLLEKCCMTEEELESYAPESLTVYAWHITDLKVYDKPRGLGEFRKWFEFIQKNLDKGYGCRSGDCDAEYNWHCAIECYGYDDKDTRLTRPPQSWQYVEEIQ